jgi:hypothetical protein
MAKNEGRGTTRRFFFRDQEMNFTMYRALMASYAGGAAIGECLSVAESVNNGDARGYGKAWMALGERLAAKGDASLSAGDRLRAREFFLRASNYGASDFCVGGLKKSKDSVKILRYAG